MDLLFDLQCYLFHRVIYSVCYFQVWPGDIGCTRMLSTQSVAKALHYGWKIEWKEPQAWD